MVAGRRMAGKRTRYDPDDESPRKELCKWEQMNVGDVSEGENACGKRKRGMGEKTPNAAEDNVGKRGNEYEAGRG